jgi:OOP family OmpA-OmpF porin
MNAKQAVCSGIVAAVLGFGPTVASADPYFALFFGTGQIDLSQSDLNRVAANRTAQLGGTAPTGRSDLDDMDKVWGVQIGYRFNRWVAAEVGYVDLGRANYVADLTSDFGTGPFDYQVRGRFISSGPTLAVVPTIPLGERFELYGRAGIYFADTRFRVRTETPAELDSVEAKAGTQDLFGGLGFAWNINDSYALRVEGAYFLNVGDDDRTGETDVAMIAIGLAFR